MSRTTAYYCDYCGKIIDREKYRWPNSPSMITVTIKKEHDADDYDKYPTDVFHLHANPSPCDMKPRGKYCYEEFRKMIHNFFKKSEEE